MSLRRHTKASLLKNHLQIWGHSREIRSNPAPVRAGTRRRQTIVHREYEPVDVKHFFKLFFIPVPPDSDDVASPVMGRDCSLFLVLQSQKMCMSESRIVCCGFPVPCPTLPLPLYNFTQFSFQVCMDLKGWCTLSLIFNFFIQHKRTYPHAGRKTIHPLFNIRLKQCQHVPGKDRFFMDK